MIGGGDGSARCGAGVIGRLLLQHHSSAWVSIASAQPIPTRSSAPSPSTTSTPNAAPMGTMQAAGGAAWRPAAMPTSTWTAPRRVSPAG